MTRNQRLNERNAKVRDEFYKVQSKNPKWRMDAVIEEVANKFFLSTRTIDAIITFEGIYNDHTVASQNMSQLKMF